MRYLQLLSQEDRVGWNTMDETRDSPLMFCLKAGKMEMVKVLLKNPGVNIHTANKEGKFLETIARLVLWLTMFLLTFSVMML